METNAGRPIRVLAFMEARWVTGPAKNLIAFAAQLQKMAGSNPPGIELSVATFDRASAPAERFVSALKAAGIPAHVIRESRAGDLRVFPRLLAIVRSVKPDIVQTHNTKSHVLVWIAGLARRVPWIAFFHGFTNLDARDRFYNRICSWMLRRPRHVVTVCRAFALDLGRAGVPVERISVRHNIVAPFVPPLPAELAALRLRLDIPVDCRIVLAVGRLSREKGHADLIDAISRLRSRRDLSNLRCIIVGDGPVRDALERRSRERGLAGCVLFAGHQEKVQPYYGLADIFVLPSHSEGSPNVLLEAMAAGLPIVTTNAGGAGELAADGESALVVNRRDPQALSRGIDRLLGDPELAARLGRAAEAASRSYTAESYAAALVQIYGAALAGPPFRDAHSGADPLKPVSPSC